MELLDQLKEKPFLTATTSHIPRGPFLGRLELLKEAAKCGLDRCAGVDLGTWMRVRIRLLVMHGKYGYMGIWVTGKGEGGGGWLLLRISLALNIASHAYLSCQEDTENADSFYLFLMVRPKLLCC